MAKRDKTEKHVAQPESAEDHHLAALQHQKIQLVNAFNDLAASMRKAAQEAEAMASTVANANLSEGSRAALHRNATDMIKAVQAPVAPPAPRSPVTDKNSNAMSGVTATGTVAAPATSRKRKSKADDEVAHDANGTANGKEKDQEKKPKKEKKPRDPNLPKRPASAYIHFQNEVRAEIKKAHPELDYKTILQEVSKEWANLSEEKRAPYHAIVDKNKAVYEDAMKMYGEQKATGAAPAAAPSRSAAPPPAPHAAPAPPASTSGSEESEEDEEGGSSSEESGSSSDSEEEESDSEEEEAAQQAPPAKKRKSQPAPPPIASVQSTKKTSKK